MLKNLSSHYEFVMRMSLAFVFVWFGVSEIINPVYWSGYVPQFVLQFFPFSVNIFVQGHGIVLLLLGLSLFFRIHIFFTGAITMGVLLLIISGLIMTDGFSEIVVRDIGLFGLALAIWLNEIRQKKS